MRIGIVLGALLVSGCVVEWQSDVQQIGEDTYQVSAKVRGGRTDARDLALSDANEKCGALGKQIEVVDIETKRAWLTFGAATVTFKCLEPKGNS